MTAPQTPPEPVIVIVVAQLSTGEISYRVQAKHHPLRSDLAGLLEFAKFQILAGPPPDVEKKPRLHVVQGPLPRRMT